MISVTKRLTAIELEMHFNSTVSVVIMTVKSVSYTQLAFGLSTLSISDMTMRTVSVDVFSTINLVSLLALSSTTRAMIVELLLDRKLQL